MSRPATEIIYDNNEVFEIGKAKVLKQSSADVCLVIAAGITLDQALKAYTKLEALGLKIRVMDPFTVKPIDKEGILKNAAECNGKIVVVEDHYSEVSFEIESRRYIRITYKIYSQLVFINPFHYYYF